MKEKLVNIIVPFGYSSVQPERERILRYVIKDCLQTQTYPNRKIILAELSEYPTQEDYAQQNCDGYIFQPLRNGKEFGPGIVQNIGFRRSPAAPLTYIHQADFLLPSYALEQFVNFMDDTSAPVIFPFFSAINLSRPISVGLLNRQVNSEALYNALVRVNSELKKLPANLVPHVVEGRNRVALSDQQVDIIDIVLPPELRSRELSTLSHEDAWGEIDGAYALYVGRINGRRFLNTVNYRVGPRAKASYLVTSNAYRELGGVPEYEGWGYEDLMFWEKVKVLYRYFLKGNSIQFRQSKLTSNLPLVHIWHSVAQRPEYFSFADSNKDKYEKFLALPREEKIRQIKSLN